MNDNNRSREQRKREERRGKALYSWGVGIGSCGVVAGVWA